MKSCILVLSLLLTIQIVIASATRIVTTPAGTWLEASTGVEPVRGPVRMTTDDPEVLWSRNLAAGIFNSVATADSVSCYSGSGLNAPREAVQYDLLSGTIGFSMIDSIGSPEWEVSASADGMYWAALRRNADGANARLYFISALDADTVWSYELGTGYAAGTRGLQFSRNNQFLVLFKGVSQFEPPHVYVWDLDTQGPQPMLIYDVPVGEGLSARALAVSHDGMVIAATADQYCHVIDLELGTAREVFNIGASTDGLAISADGNWIAHGFTAVFCRRWNGTNYVVRWQNGLNQRYLSHVLISPDTSYVVSCWYRNTYLQNYIRVHNIQNGSPLWAHTYEDGIDYQDLPSDVDISDDGNWFAVGSWGDAGSMNGEVNVFSRWYRDPYYQLNMAGSCFSLDLSSDGNYLVAAGKHVHANVFGNGGDFYAVNLDLPPAEPSPFVASPIEGPELICACRDTVGISVHIGNTGYAPFTVDSIVVQCNSTGDSCWSQFDSWVFETQVNPGDTITASGRFYVCDEFWDDAFDCFVYLSDTTLVAQYSPEYIWDCTDLEDLPVLHPSSFTLSTFPNPFNSSTRIRFTLPGRSEIRLSVFDVLGRSATPDLTKAYSAGMHDIMLNVDDLTTGVYFVALHSIFGERTQKIVLLR